MIKKTGLYCNRYPIKKGEQSFEFRITLGDTWCEQNFQREEYYHLVTGLHLDVSKDNSN
jgi:hypothetical protein